MRFGGRDFHGLSRLPAAALCLALTVFSADAPPQAPATLAAAPSAEQKAELRTLDLEIARFDTLVGKVSDRQEKASVKAFLDGFKDRRVALRAAFNHDVYTELRWEIDVEYQRLVAWLAAPSATVPGAKVEAPGDIPVVFLLSPSPADPAETEAALYALDREIERREETARTLPGGPVREAEMRRVAGWKAGRRELGVKFTKQRWDAVVGDMKARRGEVPATPQSGG